MHAPPHPTSVPLLPVDVGVESKLFEVRACSGEVPGRLAAHLSVDRELFELRGDGSRQEAEATRPESTQCQLHSEQTNTWKHVEVERANEVSKQWLRHRLYKGKATRTQNGAVRDWAPIRRCTGEGDINIVDAMS